jgi:hypothetical protein
MVYALAKYGGTRSFLLGRYLFIIFTVSLFLNIMVITARRKFDILLQVPLFTNTQVSFVGANLCFVLVWMVRELKVVVRKSAIFTARFDG